MNLEHVSSYLAVLRTGSFHAAATRRGLSQASVSQHIRALEESVGTPLVVRDRAGCRPVAGTEEFTRHAGLLIDLAERAARALSQPMLAVGASSNIGTYLVQPMFKRFSDEHAGSLETDLAVGPNHHIADRLSAGTLDVVFMEWWDGRTGFDALRWRDEELVVIVGPDHPWTSRDEVTMAELAGQRILGGEPGTGTGTLLRDRLGPAAGDLRIAMDLGNTEAVKRAVRHDLGVSLVLAGTVRDEVAGGTLHALRIAGTSLRKPLWIGYPKGLPPSSPARQFVTWVKDQTWTS